ncbi:restriction endonuclease [Kitasatospora sp. NBC_01560]|uniref:restriction endonuclease n=1 Tax=Kitasatospora sp. NBC_01560 TaxID=2975965 RepID=UPI00386DDDCD
MSDRTPTAQPPVADPKIPLLPFDSQNWADFERLACELVEAAEGLTRVARYGTAGQAQGGIDVVGRASDGRWSAFQVKHVAEFSVAAARKVLNRFVHGNRPHRATRLVIVTSCRGTNTQVRELALECQAEFPDLQLGRGVGRRALGPPAAAPAVDCRAVFR